MIALWMLYSLGVAALMAAAAASTERTLLLFRRPVRVVWAVALVASVFLPLLALVLGSAPLGWALATLGENAGAGSVSGGGLLALTSRPGTADATGAGSAFLQSAVAWARGMDGPLAVMWGLLSLLVGGRLALQGWRLRRSRRTEWGVERHGPFRVLVAPATGPAVTGALRPEIVVPSWFGELEEDLRRAALRHENEHRRVGDPWLLAAARSLLVAMPWNPALWWSVARFRRAVELDCDRRVLERGTDPGTYGRLLVRVSQMSRGRRLLGAVTLTERKSHLERRIRAMLDVETKWRNTKALAGVAAAALAVVLACEAPPPGPDETGAENAAVSADERPGLPGGEAAAQRRVRVDSARIFFAPEGEGARLEGRLAPVDPGAAPKGDPAERRARVLFRERRQGEAVDAVLTERPVVVVDGVIQASDASLSEINRLDIRSIEVLKGAAATERHGERGQDGVVLITTKDGAVPRDESDSGDRGATGGS